MAANILTPPDSSDLATASARDWALRVLTGPGPDGWTFVRGLSKIAPTRAMTFQDDADLDARGAKSELATASGWTIECDGLRKGEYTADTLAPDPAQEFLRAKGMQTGYANVVRVQWYRTDDLPESFEGAAAVEWKDAGGDKEGLAQFSLTLRGRGRALAVDKPTAGAGAAAARVGDDQDTPA